MYVVLVKSNINYLCSCILRRKPRSCIQILLNNFKHPALQKSKNTLVTGGGIYNHTHECCTDDGIYNHLNETRANREDISSPYDHASYIPTRPQQTDCLDSGYMHINKVE